MGGRCLPGLYSLHPSFHDRSPHVFDITNYLLSRPSLLEYPCDAFPDVAREQLDPGVICNVTVPVNR